MSSIITAVFQATIGLLVNKGRDKAAYKLKEGDVTDQKFRVLIVRELDDIKTKLDGLARKDLLASISFFKEGIEFLYEVFDQASFRNECGDVTADLTALSAVATVNNAKTFSLAEGMRKLGLTGMDESATRTFSNAKERFKDARRKATEAFNNEASELPDRILAMQYRVMSTILETLDNPRDAIPACRVCIEELHSLPAVQKCFDVELKKGFWALFSKDERRKIISSVCHVNRVMYDVTLMVGRGEPGLNCSLVDIDSANQIDPLRDRRVTPVLHEVGMEHCCVIWSFGQEGIGEHKLNDPRDIATNSQGQFIIADMVEGNIKIFDRSGKFLHDFCVTANANLCIYDVAIDRYDNSYVLVRNPTKPGHEDVLYVFDHTSKLRHNFPLLANGAWYYRVSVNMANGKVLLLGRLKAKYVVDLYESDGQFVRRFGERILRSAEDITAANNDRVIVVDRCDLRVHVFSEKGDHLKQFMLLDDYYSHRIAFHWASQQVVVTGQRDRKDGRYIYIYSVDGELLRSIHVDEKCFHFTGITVTTGGSIAVTFQEKNHEGKVLVL